MSRKTHSSSSPCTSSRGRLGEERPPTTEGSPVRREGREAEGEGRKERERGGRRNGRKEGGREEWDNCYWANTTETGLDNLSVDSQILKAGNILQRIY